MPERQLPILAIGGSRRIGLDANHRSSSILVARTFRNSGPEALGLPEGSIRAVIALSLIVLFAILAVDLYANVSTGGRLNTVQNLSLSVRPETLRVI